MGCGSATASVELSANVTVILLIFFGSVVLAAVIRFWIAWGVAGVMSFPLFEFPKRIERSNSMENNRTFATSPVVRFILKRMRSIQLLVCVLLVTAANAAPNLAGKTERPLRYRPEGGDFVIEN